MMFVIKYEPICILVDNSVITLGLFNSYEEANDAAISRASESLPKESVRAYQINKCFCNAAIMDVNNP